MEWVFFAIAVGLVGFLIEMALRYRRESAATRTRQHLARRDIKKAENSMEKVRAKIGAAQSAINSLKAEKEQLAGDVKEAGEQLETMSKKEARRRPGRMSVDRDQAES